MNFESFSVRQYVCICVCVHALGVGMCAQALQNYSI